MLIACHSCHRQYDVGTHPPGAKIRCFCGSVCVVPKQKPRDIKMMHCASCGAVLEKDATACQYCRSEVTLGERGLGDVCPGCFSRMVAGARFCCSCGLAIEPQAVVKGLTTKDCPRCKEKLSGYEVAGTAFVECTKCAGIWLDEDVFAKLAESHEQRAATGFLRPDRGAGPGKAAATAGAGTQKVAYIPCPVCGQMMNRKNFARASGVIIDWCRGHGYWFDAEELERILAFIDAGGMEEARRREIAQEKAKLRRLRTQPMPVEAAGMAWPRSSERPADMSLLHALSEFVGSLFR